MNTFAVCGFRMFIIAGVLSGGNAAPIKAGSESFAPKK